MQYIIIIIINIIIIVQHPKDSDLVNPLKLTQKKAFALYVKMTVNWR